MRLTSRSRLTCDASAYYGGYGGYGIARGIARRNIRRAAYGGIGYRGGVGVRRGLGVGVGRVGRFR